MSSLAAALLAELDDQALDELADALWPRLRARLEPQADRWLTTAEAAEHLGISIDALHRLTAARAIPFSQERPGAKCYFRQLELDSWREQGHQAAA